MKLFDRVAVLTATTGTGTITLGAVLGTNFFTFAEQGAEDTDEVYYMLNEGGDVEIGIGTLGSTATTLSRDTVLSSRITGVAGTSKMSLGGSAQVRCISPSMAFEAIDGTVTLTASTSIAGHIPVIDPDFYRTLFFDTNKVAGSGAIYRKVVSEPAHAGKRQNGNSTWYEICSEYVTPEMLGARADDTTNDASAFTDAQAAAIAIGVAVVVSGATYLVNTTVSIVAGAHWEMRSPVIRTSLDTMTIFSAASVDDWSISGRCFLLGSLTTAAETAQFGLDIENCNSYLIEGVCARDLKGKGFYLHGSSAGTYRGDRGQFIGCSAVHCTVGRQLDAGAGAEYTTWSNWHASGNVTADIIGAGNTVTTGGTVVDNTTGVSLVSGANHGHGIYSGVEISHNTVNVDALDVTNGFGFSGCHMYDGDILLENCAGIVISGGVLDEPSIVVTTGASHSWNYIRDVWCPGTYGTMAPSGTGVALLAVQNLSGPGAPTGGTFHLVESHVYRGAGSTQSLTSGVTTPLVFPSEVSDVAGAYNSGTGVFTIPAGQGGVYEISWSAVFGGSSLSETASYLSLQADDGAGGSFTDLVLDLPSKYTTTKLTSNSTVALRLAAGVKVRLVGTISGTSPVFGDSTWLCAMSFKRLGK